MNIFLLKNKLIKNWQIIGLFFVFFAFRLYHLGFHDFWYDEIGTIRYARYPWGNWNAPFYWILLHFWTKIFGISEFSLRFPSLIFSFSSCILIFILGKELFNKKTGIIASIFMGLSPFHLWYAQEARDYSLVLFLGLLSSYILLKALKDDKNKQWLFFAVISLLGIYTNYFYIFLFLAQSLYLIFFKRLRLGFKEIIGFLIIALGFSFYLPRFLSKFYYVWGGFWIPKPKWGSLIITLENFILGYNGLPLLYIFSNIFAVLFFISTLIVVYKKRELRKSFTFCLFLFSVPIIAAYIFSKVFFSVYLDRGLIVFSPYFYLILALGIVSLNKRIRITCFIILIPILLVSDYRYFNDRMFAPIKHHTGTYIKKPIKPIAEFLESNLSLGDILAFTNTSIAPSLGFYSQRKIYPFYYFFDPKLLETNWQRPIQENRYCIPFHKINNIKFRRLWVVACDWARSGDLCENSRMVKNWLDNNLKLEFTQELDGLWILRYVKK